MKVLSCFKALGPCGIRTVFETLSQTDDNLEQGDVKREVRRLIDEGLLTQQSNKQYKVTAEGDKLLSGAPVPERVRPKDIVKRAAPAANLSEIIATIKRGRDAELELARHLAELGYKLERV